MGFEFAGFDDARSRKSSDLRIDRTEHREFTQHDLVSGKCNQRSAGHGIDRNIDGYFGLVCFHCAGDLHRREPLDHRGVWSTRSIGILSSGVSLIAAMIVWAPSRSMCRETAARHTIAP